MILGKVHMCEHYSQLKKYKTAITRECMKYQNHVANAIKPGIYETPYIGKQAIKVQLEQAQEKQKQMEKQIVEIKQQIEQLQGIIDTLGNTVVPIKYDKIWTLKEGFLFSVKAFIGEKEEHINLHNMQNLQILDGLKYIRVYSVEEFKQLTQV